MPGFHASPRLPGRIRLSISRSRPEIFREKYPDVTNGPQTVEDREKLILKVRSLFRKPLSDWYARPFTLREAKSVLASAGIEFEKVTGTALSGRSDPMGESQVIEAVVAGREIHFCLQYSGKWKVVKAFAASSMTDKTAG